MRARSAPGRALRLCLVAAALLITFGTTGCASREEGDRELETLTIAVKNNPDLELIATDERARILTVRVKSADRVITVTPANLKDGRLVIDVASAQPQGQGGGAAGRSTAAVSTPAPEARSAESSAAPAAKSSAQVTTGTPRGGVAIDAGGRQVEVGAGGVRVQAGDRSARVETPGTAATREPAPAVPAPQPAAPPASASADEADSGATDDEDAPARTPRRTLREAVRCEANEVLRLDNVSLNVADDAVHASGNCRLIITNSEITGGDYAVRADGMATVDIVDSRVSGRRGAIQASGAAAVSGRDSEFRGAVRTSGGAKFRDLGGNTGLR